MEHRGDGNANATLNVMVLKHKLADEYLQMRSAQKVKQECMDTQTRAKLMSLTQSS